MSVVDGVQQHLVCAVGTISCKGLLVLLAAKDCNIRVKCVACAACY